MKCFDITAQVEELVAQEKVQEGLVVVYSPYTTAGITINENADPDVPKVILRRLDATYPNEGGWTPSSRSLSSWTENSIDSAGIISKMIKLCLECSHI